MSLAARYLHLLALSLPLSACGSEGDPSTPQPRQPAIDRNLPTVTEQPSNLPGYNVYRPADLDATGAPLPVIVWANGGCFRIDSPWKDLLTRWAQAGFVVVAITTPAGGDPLAAGMSTADDQAKAVDWAFAESGRSGGQYAGRFDLSRIVAAGNSCGGITALTLTSQDKRVRSAFVLSGSSAFPGAPKEAAAAVMSNIDVPVGFAVGGPEDIARGNAQQDFELLPAGVPGYVAQRSEGAHEKVSTDAAILAEVAEISTNWIDFGLYGNSRVRETFLDEPCGTCAAGTWTIDSKNLDAVDPRGD
jgi:dienelactone hydrolase